MPLQKLWYELRDAAEELETTIWTLLHYAETGTATLHYKDRRGDWTQLPKELAKQLAITSNDSIYEPSVSREPIVRATLAMSREELNRLRVLSGDVDRLAAYLDRTHEYFSSELEAAVAVWTTLYDQGGTKPKFSHKDQIGNWLRKNRESLSREAVKRIAVMVNPRKRGGAPKSE